MYIPCSCHRRPSRPERGAWVLRMVCAFSIKEMIGTVFLLSLHFAPFLSKLFGEKTTENHCVRPPFPVKRSKTAQDAVSVFVHYATSPSQSDNKTQVFVHFPRMITTHSFRHAPQPSVKISTIADEERNPATSGRSPADHSRVCRTYLRNSALRQTCRKPDLDPFQ